MLDWKKNLKDCLKMNLPKHITFTGFDADCISPTNIHKLIALSMDYPIEIGILFSLSKEDNRYTGARLLALRKYLVERQVKFSAHLCGQIAREAKAGINLSEISPKQFQRVQINSLSYENAESIDVFQQKVNVPVILQWRNSKIFPYEDDTKIQYLFDKSGGKGKVANKFPPMKENQFVGYAGGFTPENVKEQLQKIDAKNYWIDMESGVRTDDWLDLDKCRKVCEEVYGT